ncbi:hypothetical protein [Ponticoccus alexandrii]|uniref:hypothetical protein n=1 Tax=Ponticoccus alexandrii TaxID=1943633 RepID=UPI0020410613|nr:hypothetical protein [Ponticoccus alexandrii]
MRLPPPAGAILVGCALKPHRELAARIAAVNDMGVAIDQIRGHQLFLAIEDRVAVVRQPRTDGRDAALCDRDLDEVIGVRSEAVILQEDRFGHGFLLASSCCAFRPSRPFLISKQL